MPEQLSLCLNVISNDLTNYANTHDHIGRMHPIRLSMIALWLLDISLLVCYLHVNFSQLSTVCSWTVISSKCVCGATSIRKTWTYPLILQLWSFEFTIVWSGKDLKLSVPIMLTQQWCLSHIIHCILKIWTYNYLEAACVFFIVT